MIPSGAGRGFSRACSCPTRRGPGTVPRCSHAGRCPGLMSGVISPGAAQPPSAYHAVCPRGHGRGASRDRSRCLTRRRGRDAAALIRNGTLRGLSVEFRAERETFRDGLRVIQRARLTGAGLVDSPSYAAPVEVRRQESEAARMAVSGGEA